MPGDRVFIHGDRSRLCGAILGDEDTSSRRLIAHFRALLALAPFPLLHHKCISKLKILYSCMYITELTVANSFRLSSLIYLIADSVVTDRDTCKYHTSTIQTLIFTGVRWEEGIAYEPSDNRPAPLQPSKFLAPSASGRSMIR